MSLISQCSATATLPLRRRRPNDIDMPLAKKIDPKNRRAASADAPFQARARDSTTSKSTRVKSPAATLRSSKNRGPKQQTANACEKYHASGISNDLYSEDICISARDANDTPSESVRGSITTTTALQPRPSRQRCSLGVHDSIAAMTSCSSQATRARRSYIHIQMRCNSS